MSALNEKSRKESPIYNFNNPIDNIDTIQYNYLPTTFYKNQFESTFEKNGFIKAPYTSKSNEPNIAVFDKGYVTKNIYIVAPLHKIAGINHDAELIVEHRALTNSNDPFYTCFLLTSSPYAHNNIDQLIEGKFDTTLELNTYLKKEKTVFYKDKTGGSVAIFSIPIEVGTIFKKGNKAELPFMTPSETYSILLAKPILGEPIIEGATGTSATDPPMGEMLIPDPASGFPKLSDISPKTAADTASSLMPNTVTTVSNNVSVAGYCQPIDETDPTIGDTANVVIPIDSRIVKNDATGTTIRTLLNFFGFFILVIAAVFVTPIAHKVMIVELINDNETFSAQRKLNRANAADVYTGAVFFGFGVAFINYGIINNKPMATILGFYTFVFFMASLIVLQYERVMKPEKYLKNFETKGVMPSFDNIEMDWGFFTDNIVSLFFKKEMEPDPDRPGEFKEVKKFQIGFLIVSIMYSLLFMLLKKLKITKNGGKFFMTSIYFYMFLLAIYLYALIGHYRYVNSKLNEKK